LLFGLFGLVPGARRLVGGPKPGSRWSARSAVRTNDLEAGEDPPHTRSARRRGVGAAGFKSCLPPVRERGAGDALERAGAQPYLGPRTMSGDMMMDGVPGVRAAEGAAAQSFRVVHLRGRGWRQESCGSWPRASGDLWAGHAYNAFRRPPPCRRGPASPARHRRVHAGCDSCGAAFCVRPPGSGSCRCRGGRPACGSRHSPASLGEPRT